MLGLLTSNTGASQKVDHPIYREKKNPCNYLFNILDICNGRKKKKTKLYSVNTYLTS